MAIGRWRIERFHESFWLSLRREAARPDVHGGDALNGESAARQVDAWFPEGWGTAVDASLLADIGAALHEVLHWGHDEAASRWLKGVVRQALRDGRLVAVRADLPAPAGSIGERLADEAPSTPTVQRRKDEEAEALTNPRWSAPRVEVGTELFAIVTYTDIKAPVDATLVISEVDRGTARQQIARIHTTVPTGSGDHKVKWKRKPEEAQADLEEDEAARDSGPLEYRFKIETRAPKCFDESGPLWLTNTVTVNLVKEKDGKKHEKARVVVLKDALDEEFRAKSQDGTAKFEKVLVGPVEIRLAEPRFTDLCWSAPKVPVGEPVDAVFTYEDAIAGMNAEVVVHELNHDGSSAEIERLKVELAAASGEAKVSFTRTEDEAQGDIDADEREGDTGPLEYRYRVVAEGGSESDASEPLWLTHAVILKLADNADGRSFPDGQEIELVAADGTEHRAALAGGQVRFEEVVCGPMTIRLAPRAEEGGMS